MVIIILEFLIFAFLGWAIDSAYRSFRLKKIVNGGFFRGPICPIYGIGGLVLVFFFKYFIDIPVWLLILSAGLSMVLVEYVGGVFCEKVLQIKLWDYTSSRFDIGGHIDLVHSFFWIILSAVFYFFIFPPILQLEKLVQAPKYLDFPLLLAFIIIFGWLTIRKVPSRFLEFKEDVLNLSLGEYQQLVADIKKYYRQKSEKAKAALVQRIDERLKKAGVKMKK